MSLLIATIIIEKKMQLKAESIKMVPNSHEIVPLLEIKSVNLPAFSSTHSQFSSSQKYEHFCSKLKSQSQLHSLELKT